MYQIRRLWTGLGLLLVAVASGGVILGHSSLHFRGDPAAPPQRLEIAHTLADDARTGTTQEVVYRVAVLYPPEMRVVDSRTVEMTFDAVLRDGGREISLSRLGTAVEAGATLSGAAFDVSPRPTLERRSVPPLVFRWSIKASGEGRHELILDAADLLTAGPPGATRGDVVVNGRQVTGFDAELIPLHVRVVTSWGISRNAYNGIQGVLGLIGFILMYPLWIEGMRRAMGWHRATAAPAPRPGAAAPEPTSAGEGKGD